MSCSLRGISCQPHTIACTSNHKFLPLYDPVYKKVDNFMYTYPAENVNSTPKDSNDDSGHIQTYYGKMFEGDEIDNISPDHSSNNHVSGGLRSNRSLGHDSCKTCSK